MGEGGGCCLLPAARGKQTKKLMMHVNQNQHTTFRISKAILAVIEIRRKWCCAPTFFAFCMAHGAGSGSVWFNELSAGSRGCVII